MRVPTKDPISTAACSDVGRRPGGAGSRRRSFASATARLGRAGALLGLGAALAGCAGNGGDYFDDGSAEQQKDRPLLMGVLTGSVFDPPTPKIEYAARSPLVVPPSSDLPEPEAKGAVVQKAGQWPKDPDVARKEAAAKNTGPTPAEVLNDQMHSGERLSPQQVQEGRVAGGGLTSNSYRMSESNHPDRVADRLTPEQLNQKIATPSTSRQAEIGANATRRYLIEPPVEYRQPATTAAMPNVKEKIDKTSEIYYDPKQSVRDNPAISGN